MGASCRPTVVDDSMQRAPVFMFTDALAARAFGTWVDESLELSLSSSVVHGDWVTAHEHLGRNRP